jgi:hypothetical protein
VDTVPPDPLAALDERVALLRAGLSLVDGIDVRPLRTWVPRGGRLVLVTERGAGHHATDET